MSQEFTDISQLDISPGMQTDSLIYSILNHPIQILKQSPNDSLNNSTFSILAQLQQSPSKQPQKQPPYKLSQSSDSILGDLNQPSNQVSFNQNPAFYNTLIKDTDQKQKLNHDNIVRKNKKELFQSERSFSEHYPSQNQFQSTSLDISMDETNKSFSSDFQKVNLTVEEISVKKNKKQEHQKILKKKGKIPIQQKLNKQQIGSAILQEQSFASQIDSIFNFSLNKDRNLKKKDKQVNIRNKTQEKNTFEKQYSLPKYLQKADYEDMKVCELCKKEYTGNEFPCCWNCAFSNKQKKIRIHVDEYRYPHFVDMDVKRFTLTVNQNFFSPNLQKIHAVVKNYTDKTLFFLIDNAFKFPFLQYLNLATNKITDQGLIRLAEKGFKFSMLKCIYFPQNLITSRGLVALSEKADIFPNLQLIDLELNQVESGGLISLAFNGKNIPKLKAIFLSWNLITDEGVIAFAEYGHKFKELEKIQFSNNRITNEGLKRLIERGCTQKFLTQVDLFANDTCLKDLVLDEKLKWVFRDDQFKNNTQLKDFAWDKKLKQISREDIVQDKEYMQVFKNDMVSSFDVRISRK